MRVPYMILGLAFVSASAIAETPQSGKNVELGEQTRAWLDLQREGQAASSQPLPIAGPVAARIYQRYQDSFSHPIPEYFSGDDADASVLGD